VDNQTRRLLLLYHVAVAEGRHSPIDVLRLPEVALLVLEAERRQRPIISTAPKNARVKQVRVRDQISTHKRPVRVPANSTPFWIAHAHSNHLVLLGLINRRTAAPRRYH